MFSKIEVLNLVESLAQMDSDDIQMFSDILMQKYPKVAESLGFALYVSDMENSMVKNMEIA
jgi:hypothetical protein